MESKIMEGILEGIKEYPSEKDRLQELTRRVYQTIPEMFDGTSRIEPAGVEIHFEKNT